VTNGAKNLRSLKGAKMQTSQRLADRVAQLRQTIEQLYREGKQSSREVVTALVELREAQRLHVNALELERWERAEVEYDHG